MNQRATEVLSRVFGLSKAEIHLDLTKDDVGSWDSLKQMDLVASLEKEFGITLGITEIIRMQSVRDILEVLKEQGIDHEN
jgi:acyl carrier protein